MKKWLERVLIPRRIEERISHLRLESLLEATAYIVWIADKRGILTDTGANQWRALVGMPEDMSNSEWENFCIHPDDMASIRDAWVIAKRTRTKFTIQYRLRVKDIGYRFFQRTAVPVIDENDDLIEWLGVCMDVTERRMYEEKLQSVAARAEAANKTKTEFLAVMSHELRTPLTAVIGFGELLNDGVFGPCTEEQKDAINRIQLNGTHLIGMIDQILNFSAIEAGDVALILEVVSMHKIIVQIMEFMNPIAEQRGIKLLCDCPKNIIISTDVTKLRQIVVNLVGNGIKFTQHGTVLIRVDDGGDDIALHVEDTGIGIPVEFQDRIFEKFWQVKQGLTRNVGGAGLGLTIVKRFTELLGGEIYVNSVPTSNGVSGSTFTIKLPKNLPLVHVETISK